MIVEVFNHMWSLILMFVGSIRDFIAEQLRITKLHNFFLSSLNKSLTLIIPQKCFKIKGSLNNAARSRNQIMKIGKVPLLTENIKIDYPESTSFTPNGTIGVQVWISQKKSKTVENIKTYSFKCFYNKKKQSIKKLKKEN